ncbi:MAG: DUF4440 domain-containing protein [Armatimonadetes bacterium]|nr:DUF4440 domain-containing protein [Armatimonadota bacterium]
MRLVTLAATVVLLSMAVSAGAQPPVEGVKSAISAFRAAWDARDADALQACLHDPLIGHLQPGQVFDGPGMLELARTPPRQPIEVTLGPFEPEVCGDVAFALVPLHLKPAAQAGLGEFDGLSTAVVLIRSENVWRVLAHCNVWDTEAMAAWVPEAQGAAIRQVDQAARATWDDFQRRADDATVGGAVDWPAFAALFHPTGIVLGPTGEGRAIMARRLKPDGETLTEEVPEVSLAPAPDRRLVVAKGWGAIVQAYDAHASVNAGAPFPSRVIDVRCYIPDQNTWRYLFAAIVPKGE